MNALEFNNKIANLITKFITNIPTIGQFDPSRSQRPNRDFIPIIELVNLNYQLNPNDHLFTIFRLSFHNNNIILNDWET